jgi:hypothetical protein
MGRSRVLVYHTQTGQTLYNEVNSKQQEGSERRSCSIATGESAISAEDPQPPNTSQKVPNNSANARSTAT